MELVNPARPELIERQTRLAKNKYGESRLTMLLLLAWMLLYLTQLGVAVIGFLGNDPMPVMNLALGLLFYLAGCNAIPALTRQILRHRDRHALEQARQQGDIIDIPDWAHQLWQDVVAQAREESGVSTDDDSFLPTGALAFQTLASLRVDFDQYATSQAMALQITNPEAREIYESDCDLIKAAVTQHMRLAVDAMAHQILTGQGDQAALDHELTRALVERQRQLPPLD